MTAGFQTLYIDEHIESVFKISQTIEKIVSAQNVNVVSDILNLVKSQNFLRVYLRTKNAGL